MGWNSQNITQLLIINAAGGFTGLFAYSPSPGNGNLFASVTATAGTDPYGNHYGRGISVYGTGPASQSTAGLAVVAGAPVLGFGSGASSETRTAQILEAVVNPNTANEQLQLVLDGPVGGGVTPNDSVGMQFFSSSSSAPGISTGILFFADTTGAQHNVAFWGQHGFNAAITQAVVGALPGSINTTLAAESWHNLSFAAGFTAGAQTPQYQFMPLGSTGQVHLRGAIQYTAAAGAGVLIATLPAGYVPSTAQEWQTPNTVGAGLAGSIQINAAGQLLTAQAGGAIGDIIRIDGIIIQL